MTYVSIFRNKVVCLKVGHLKMGATFLFKARLCLNGLSHSSGIIHQGKMCAQAMCTKGVNPGERIGRKTDTTIRQTESVKVRKMPSFPTSVFASGNAKRTTEMLKRKTAPPSLEQEYAAGDQPRRRGFKTGSSEISSASHHSFGIKAKYLLKGQKKKECLND